MRQANAVELARLREKHPTWEMREVQVDGDGKFLIKLDGERFRQGKKPKVQDHPNRNRSNRCPPDEDGDLSGNVERAIEGR